MKKYEYGRLSSRIIGIDIKWFFSYGVDIEKVLDKNQDVLDVMNTLGLEGWRFSLEENDHGQHEKDYILYREITNE
ncbi:hypothetical protein [Paenibacillus odorifer]|uniref:hypothetical protein n=1 Tax=Paenibacillus odorifer TaxID=189426 RepID=UPI00096E0899|nr:hypothetical protein [Paenibacillus odorifer]OMD71856.1 hypothetical protein BSK50_25535 [Paenibacillus odorifer]